MRNSNVTFHRHTKEFISDRSKNKIEIKKWVNSTFIILVWLISFLFIYYLGTVNANATLGYEIRDLDIQISQLKSQKEIIETKIDKIKSLDNISNDPFSNTDMEEVNESISLVIKDGKKYVYNN